MTRTSSVKIYWRAAGGRFYGTLWPAFGIMETESFRKNCSYSSSCYTALLAKRHGATARVSYKLHHTTATAAAAAELKHQQHATRNTVGSTNEKAKLEVGSSGGDDVCILLKLILPPIRR